MKSGELKEYCEFNIVTKEWHGLYERINKLLTQYKYFDKLEDFHYEYLDYCVNRLLLISEGVFDNVGITDWFKELVEDQNVCLLWVLQEIKKNPREIVTSYNKRSHEKFDIHLDKVLSGIKEKKILMMLEE